MKTQTRSLLLDQSNVKIMSSVHTCVCVAPASYPELKPIQSINAHPSNCICIKFDPTGKYFATGSADALVSLWDVEELVCVRCFSRSVRPAASLLAGVASGSNFTRVLRLPLQAGLARPHAELQPRRQDVGIRVRGSLHRHRRGGDRSVAGRQHVSGF